MQYSEKLNENDAEETEQRLVPLYRLSQALKRVELEKLKKPGKN